MRLFNYFSWKDVLPGLNPFFILFQFFFLKWYFIKIFCWITCTLLEKSKIQMKEEKANDFLYFFNCFLYLILASNPLAPCNGGHWRQEWAVLIFVSSWYTQAGQVWILKIQPSFQNGFPKPVYDGWCQRPICQYFIKFATSNWYIPKQTQVLFSLWSINQWTLRKDLRGLGVKRTMRF